MAISPQYSNKWRIIPFAEGTPLSESTELYITWRDDIEYHYESETPDWDILGVFDSLAIAEHVVTLHNEWYEKWYNSLPYSDEVEFGFCGNTKERES